MTKFIILIRGINVGGKGRVSMATLKECLEAVGFAHVLTYIASGNVVLSTNLEAKEVKEKIEKLLTKEFKIPEESSRVLVLTPAKLRFVVKNKPKGFGDEPDKYHSDVIFLMDIDTKEAMQVFDPKDGVDKIWPGKGVVYSQRLSAMRTKSRLSKIIATKAYKSMTIRTWNTATKLLDLVS